MVTSFQVHNPLDIYGILRFIFSNCERIIKFSIFIIALNPSIIIVKVACIKLFLN